jgi:hypothetical protein
MVPIVPLFCHLRHAQGGDGMGTTWNTNQDENKNKSNTARLAPPRKEVARLGRSAASVWTRADKIGALACLALLGVLLVVSACSKQELKSAAVNATSAAPSAPAQIQPAELSGTGTIAADQQVETVPAPKKARRKLAANVKYSDVNSGVSFTYPRKAALASGDKLQTAAPNTGADDVPMNFVEAGGSTVAAVSLPGKPYAGTDFEAAQFRVNLNRSVSAEQCPHFAFVDTSDADGEPIDAASVKVGATDMKMTSEFEGNATKQIETRYYHAYENGTCYEYVLGLATSGFGQQGVHAVDRDEVFGRLEKILATVKVRPTSEQQVAQKQVVMVPDAQEQKDTPLQDAQKKDVQKQSSPKPEPAKETADPAVAAPEPGK